MVLMFVLWKFAYRAIFLRISQIIKKLYMDVLWVLFVYAQKIYQTVVKKLEIIADQHF